MKLHGVLQWRRAKRSIWLKCQSDRTGTQNGTVSILLKAFNLPRTVLGTGVCFIGPPYANWKNGPMEKSIKKADTRPAA